jgi:hypothetical protein
VRVSSLPPSSSYPPPDPRQPPYGQPGAFGAYAYDPGPASKTLAGWSLGLAIFPSCITWIISIVFASIVISRSKDGRDHGRKMSVAALVIVGVWVVIAIAVVAILAATDADRDEAGRVTDAGRASVLDLRVGDCLPDPGQTGTKRTVDLVECDQPHRAEVYALFDLEGEYTTEDEITHLAEAGCFDRFKDYVGVAPGRSALTIYYIRPLNAVTFRQDPGVSCIALAADQLTATLKGSKR